MSYKFQPKGLDAASAKQVIEFLFGKTGEGDVDSKFLDMRTDITTQTIFQTLSYYRILEEHFDCKAAGKIANILERLCISTSRMGRLEGVAVLKQEMPKVETILRGMSQELEVKSQTEGGP